ncbi:MAG TPA: hypothetical protein VFK81_12270 [Terriglobales bacterium]|nr:hypothetical protein [Terriglobales bacterium]
MPLGAETLKPAKPMKLISLDSPPAMLIRNLNGAQPYANLPAALCVSYGEETEHYGNQTPFFRPAEFTVTPFHFPFALAWPQIRPQGAG